MNAERLSAKRSGEGPLIMPSGSDLSNPTGCTPTVRLLHELGKALKMKKVLFALFMVCAISLSASAQVVKQKTTPSKSKTEYHHSQKKVKRTSTPGQKVHNVIHPKRKHYNGVKVKHEAKKD
jgi:hypothetical protein